jgi:hypothetical protein
MDSKFAQWCSFTIMKEYLTGKFQIMQKKSAAMKPSKHFNEEGLVEIVEIPKDYFLNGYIVVERHEWDEYPTGLLEKLISSKRLVPESEIRAFYLFCKRLETLDEVVEKTDLFDVLRTELYPGGHRPIYDEDQKKEICDTFCATFSRSTYRLKYHSKENLYSKDVLVAMDKYHPLRVSRSFKNVTTERPIYQRMDDTDMTSAAIDDLFEFFGKHRELVKSGLNDIMIDDEDLIKIQRHLSDDILLAEVISSNNEPVSAIITDDQKLIDQLNRLLNRFGKVILRISVRDYIINLMEIECDFLQEMFEEWYGRQVKVYLDTGSINHYRSQLVKLDGVYHLVRQGVPKWNESIVKTTELTSLKIRRDPSVKPWNCFQVPRYLKNFTTIDAVLERF